MAAGKAKVNPAAVPSTIHGLTASKQDVAGPLKEAGDRAFVSDVNFYSLRDGDRLKATLEVARFTPDAETTSRAFQLKVAAQVGETAPRLRRLGDDLVYVSSGNRQTYYVWFRGLHLVVLGVPTEQTTGRALLREALATVKP